MFPSQMVRLKIVTSSNVKLYITFPSQMVRLKIVVPSHNPNVSLATLSIKSFPFKWYRLDPLYPCFLRKWYLVVTPSNGPIYMMFPQWYTLKLFPTQMAHFIHVSLANGTRENRYPLKWPTLSMFPLQILCFKIVCPSNGPLYPCFLCKWCALKSFLPQMTYFIHVSLANGTP